MIWFWYPIEMNAREEIGGITMAPDLNACQVQKYCSLVVDVS